MNLEINRDFILSHAEEITDVFRNANRSALENTCCEYRVYIDSDGDIDYEEWLAGDNGYFAFRDPDYFRVYLHTFCYQNYDPLNEYMDPIPEDADLDELRAECIDYILDETDYDCYLDKAIDIADRA